MTQSTLTPTAPLTSLSLTDRQREVLSEFIALRYLDSIDVKNLERFFFETQMEYLKDYTDEELIGEIEDLTETEEFNAMLEVEV
jgi:hypothetical protein